MVMTAIEALLSQKVGLDPKVISSGRIARAVETRQASCGLSDSEAYLRRVQSSIPELEALVEQLVVPETWFFRDRKPFDYLKHYITPEWVRKENRRVLQLLSVPCSSGEEPYSIAITLLEAGLLLDQFAIDAIDISYQSLAKAKRAVYSKNSFRGDEWVDRDRYFQQTPEGYKLRQGVRNLVNFQQGNVITSLPLIKKQYDIIFCRNLLIYLQPEACSQVLKALDRLLVPGGWLFVGASETGKFATEPYASQYVSVRQPFSFAYRKLETTMLQVPSKDTSKQANKLPPKAMRSLPPKPGSGRRSSESDSASRVQRANKVRSHPTTEPNRSKLQPDLQTVRKLADEGRLAEAKTLCETYLSQHRTSATAYTLLGQLYQAEHRDMQAEQCFQKALYLEPDSYDALVHLALLKEHQGDKVGAQIIQQRIQRLQNILESGNR